MLIVIAYPGYQTFNVHTSMYLANSLYFSLYIMPSTQSYVHQAYEVQ